MTNELLIQKGDNAVAQLNGTELNAKEAIKFVHDLVIGSPLLERIRTKMVGVNGEEIPAMAFNGRFLQPKSELTALTQSQRFQPTVSQVTLTPQRFVGEIRLSYEYVEENIEGDSVKNTIMTLTQKKIREDLEDLIINGNTASGSDAFLKTLNGMLALATTNVVNAGGGIYDKNVLRDIKLALPKRYRAGRREMLHVCSDISFENYADSLIQRATPLGDRAQSDYYETEYFRGTPIISSPKIPESSTASSLYLNPTNAILGIAKNITFETGKDISSQEWIIVVTTKVGFQYELEAGVVKATNIGL